MCSTLSSSDVIAIAASFIALCALAATMWQGWVAHEHSRLSVRPHLDWETRRANSSPYRLALMNNGMGPATVVSLVMTIDGTEYPASGPEGSAAFMSAASRLPRDVRWVTIAPKTPIAQGQTVPLVEFEVDSNDRSDMQAGYALLDRIGFILKYRSPYGELFELSKAEREA